MSASLGVLLVHGSSGALLCLLSSLLPCGGLSGCPLLRLLGSDGLLSCGGFGCGRNPIGAALRIRFAVGRNHISLT
jgi:hypothetical protein